MKRILTIIVIAASILSCFTACSKDEGFPLEKGKMLMLEQVRLFSEKELNEHYAGWTRDQMIFTWGEPHSADYGYYGDIWYHDYANNKMIYVRYNPEDDKVVSIELVNGKKKYKDEKPALQKGGKLLLEQVKYFSEEELKEYFIGLKMSEIIEMWGVPHSGYSYADSLNIEDCYGVNPFPYGAATSYTEIPLTHQWYYDEENKLLINLSMKKGEDDTITTVTLTSGDFFYKRVQNNNN